jgi:hypothetical protein
VGIADRQLYDLMTMVFKYQLVMMHDAGELLGVSLKHLLVVASTVVKGTDAEARVLDCAAAVLSVGCAGLASAA